MNDHNLRTLRCAGPTFHQEHLAWKIAELAADSVPVPADTQAMVINRIIDTAAVSAAAIRRSPVTVARAQAMAHPRAPGATVFGVEGTYSPAWAAFANSVAVHELHWQDTFSATDHTHPAGTIPALVAVAQHVGLRGADLVNGIATAYEVQIALAKGIFRPPDGLDAFGQLCPAVVAGVGAMLRLSPETIYSAIRHTAQLTAGTRPSGQGSMCNRNVHAPAYAGKIAVEAIDSAMHAERQPVSHRDGEDGISHLLFTDGHHPMPVIGVGEPKRAILSSYPCEHSADHHGQAAIDLAVRLRERIGSLDAIDSIVLHTSHQAHVSIGTGAGDPRKLDPDASPETLTRSVMYLFAVALQDGAWHHERSYLPERAHRADTVELWHRITTTADSEWTRRHQSVDPSAPTIGVRAAITLNSGEVIADEIAAADAHPMGARPFTRRNYIAKFTELAEGVIERREQQRFLDVVTCLSDLKRGTLNLLNPVVGTWVLGEAPSTHGIFR